MTTKQYKNEINFVKPEIVSVSQQERSRKLEFFSFILAGLTLLLTVIVSVIKIYTIANFTKAKETEASLIFQIQSPDLRHKEEFFFLTKNRLLKISEIDHSRIKTSDFLNSITEVNNLMKVEDFNLIANSAKVTIVTDDYSRFEDFLIRLDEFNIDKKSMVINQVMYADKKYKIPIQFKFFITKQ